MLFVSLAQRVRLSGQSRSNRTVQPQALLPVHTGGMTDHGAENGASQGTGRTARAGLLAARDNGLLSGKTFTNPVLAQADVGGHVADPGAAVLRCSWL